MGYVRDMQKWLRKALANLLLDLICTLFEPFGETEGLRVSTIEEFAKVLIAGEEESAYAQPTHLVSGLATHMATPDIDWLFSDQSIWSRGNNG